MNQRNYQRELDRILAEFQAEAKVPRLFLHSCCAPCSSYVLEYLSQYFEITVFYYNPNIAPEEEYWKRAEEQQRLTRQLPARYPIHMVTGPYEPERFYEAAKGLELLAGGSCIFAKEGMVIAL